MGRLRRYRSVNSQPSTSRRLLVKTTSVFVAEELERRVLLSNTLSTPVTLTAASLAQPQTVGDLPMAAQQIIAGAIVQDAKLTASDSEGYLGYSVAISGNTVVVGAPDSYVGSNDEQGAAYVFTESGSSWGNMTQTAKLTAANGAVGDCLGSAVAISGNTVVVGSAWATVTNGSTLGPGAAYVFVEPVSGWANMTQTAKLTASDGADSAWFGGAVAISGNTVVVGAYQATVGSNAQQGAAYVFTEPGTGWAGNLTQTAKLTSADGAANDQFGRSVAVSGNTVLIGAGYASIGTNGEQGAAYLFTEPGTGWANTAQSIKLTAADGAAYDDFGQAVAISGNTAVIGAWQDSVGGNVAQGAAYVFTASGSAWTQSAKLIAADGAAGNDFGTTVAISGNTALVGADDATVGTNSDEGAAYVFTEATSGWGNMTQTTKLTPADGAADDYFGGAVAISGNTVVAGAIGPTSGGNITPGSAYVFAAPVTTSITLTPPGNQTAIVGQSQSFTLGSFTETNATAPYTVTINWGDGSTGNYTIPAAGNITAESHTYASAGNDTVSLTVTDAGTNTSNPATFGVTVAAVGGKVTFASPVSYAAGNYPDAVAVGDFRGDGKLDMVVVNHNNADVSVLLGNGDGTFQAAVNYAVGNNPSGAAVGDFNGDGKLDLAVCNGADYTVSILLGKGNGTFKPAVSYATGETPSGVAVGDFNGDGKLDLLVADYYGGVSVLLGNGNGTFQPAVNYAAGSSPQSVAVGDFNGDGKLDLAVADFFGGVSVLLGNGNSTFQTAVNYAAGDNPGSVAVGDFNGDGKADLAVVDGDGHGGVSVLLGNGNGTFQAAVNYTTGNNSSAIVVGDFNSDGKADLAVANWYDATVSVLLGNGNGTFQIPVNYAAGSGPEAIAAGDFNGDGKADVAVADGGTYVNGNYNGSTVSVLRNTTTTWASNTGTFQPAVSYVTGTSPGGITGGDFNGDGKTDLAVANGNSSDVSVLLGNGNGTFQAALNYAVGSAPDALAVGDFNGDGKADLVVGNFGGASLSVLLGNGNGIFPSAVNYAVGNGPESIAVGDFNGDGKLDLAVADGGTWNGISYVGAGVSILLGNGNGTFQSAVTYDAGPSANFVAAGDFTGDGKLDLAVVYASQSMVSVLLGNGNGTFQSPIYYTVGLQPISVAVGDFNRDGKADLAVAYSGAGNVAGGVSVLLGNGNGTFQSAVNYTAGDWPVSVMMGDFNGDGKKDLALSSDFGGVSVLLGNGDGTFQPAVNFAAGSYPDSLTTGDFNGDGKPDLATADFYGGGASVLLNNTNAAATASPAFSNLTSSSSIVYGTATVTFSGTIAAGNLTPPSTENVTVTLNGVPQTAAIGANGNFSATFNTGNLAASATPYQVTYAYAGDANFNPATNSSTTQLIVEGNIVTSPGNQSVAAGNATSLNLSSYFEDSSIPAGDTVVDIQTNMPGPDNDIPLELTNAATPKTVANFLEYISSGEYANTIIHRSMPGFVIQGGGYDTNGNAITALAAIPGESATETLKNTTGTIAMALTGGADSADSATDNWFINLGNNSSLDSASDPGQATNQGPFTVFGQVIYNGMACVDAIAALPTYNAGGAFANLPLQNYTTGNITTANLVVTNPVVVPGGLNYTAVSGNTSILTASVVNGNLTLTGVAPGTTSVTVTATDLGGQTTTATFAVNVAIPTTTVVTSSNASPNYGQAVTFTATVTPASGSGETGHVTFQIDGGNVSGGPVTLVGNVATYTTSTLTAGNHTIVAIYSGDGNFSGSSGNHTQTVNKASSVLSWATPAAITYGTALSGTQLDVSANVPGNFTYHPALGTVLSPGTQLLTATFVPTDAADYNSGNDSINLTVNKAVLTVTANNLSRAYGVGNPPLTYSLAGLVNGDTAGVVSGVPSLSTTATSTSAAGTYPITIVANTLAANNYTFNMANGNLTVGRVASTTVVTSSNTAVTSGQSVTFTATVTPASAGGESGTVTFQIDGGNVSTAALSGNTASYTTASLAVGNHTIVAVYSGDGNFSGSSSPGLMQTVNGSGLVSIAGTIDVDSNGSGVYQTGDAGIPGVTVYLDANNNGQLDAGEISVETDAGGDYTFGNLAAGTYTVREVAPDGYVQTSPAAASIDVTLTAGQASTGNAFLDAAPKAVYRLYSPVTLEHLYTTDLNEYDTLKSYVGTWNGEGQVFSEYGGAGTVGGIADEPLYRLYNPSVLQHLWTTDFNEYTVLGTEGWNQEGIVGYVFPAAPGATATSLPTVPGSQALYRMMAPQVHLWTTSPSEYDTLQTEGWTGEGIIGYVL